jgi:chemotaxis protein MotA
VSAAVIGGYLMEHGKIGVLMQPAELLIIGGAALGTLLTANPLATLLRIFKGLAAVLKGSSYTKARYIETLRMLSELFNHGRKNGMVEIEQDVEGPTKSPVFKKYPNFLKDRHALATVAEALPGLGIVAAVLGVVLTMGALGGPWRRSGTKSRRRWWVRFSGFCCATVFWVRWLPISPS